MTRLALFLKFKEYSWIQKYYGWKTQWFKTAPFHSCVSWAENPIRPSEGFHCHRWWLELFLSLLKGQSWAIWKKTLLYSLFLHLNLTHLPSAKANLKTSLFDTQLTRNFCWISVPANNQGYRTIPSLELLKWKLASRHYIRTQGQGLRTVTWQNPSTSSSQCDRPSLSAALGQHFMSGELCFLNTEGNQPPPHSLHVLSFSVFLLPFQPCHPLHSWDHKLFLTEI